MAIPFGRQALAWKARLQDNSVAHPPQHAARSARRIKSKEVLVGYLHRAAGYPPKKTWLQAIKQGFFAAWPGLAEELARRHLPGNSEEMAAGHLHARRQGINFAGSEHK